MAHDLPLDEPDGGWPATPDGEIDEYPRVDLGWWNPTEALPMAVRRYLMPSERDVIAVRQHWITLLLPAAVFLGGLAAAVALNSWLYATGRASVWPVRLIWWAFLAAAAWSGWKWLQWRQSWFVATAYRLMRIDGVFLRHVRMLPFSKLRDMEFDQPVLGLKLGYGTFHCTSIATDHALSTVGHIPFVEAIYREVCGLIMPGEGRLGPRLAEMDGGV